MCCYGCDLVKFHVKQEKETSHIRFRVHVWLPLHQQRKIPCFLIFGGGNNICLWVMREQERLMAPACKMRDLSLSPEKRKHLKKKSKDLLILIIDDHNPIASSLLNNISYLHSATKMLACMLLKLWLKQLTSKLKTLLI